MSDALPTWFRYDALLRATSGRPSALVEACTAPGQNDPTAPSLEDMQAAAELRQAGRLH